MGKTLRTIGGLALIICAIGFFLFLLHYVVTRTCWMCIDKELLDRAEDIGMALFWLSGTAAAILFGKDYIMTAGEKTPKFKEKTLLAGAAAFFVMALTAAAFLIDFALESISENMWRIAAEIILIIVGIKMGKKLFQPIQKEDFVLPLRNQPNEFKYKKDIISVAAIAWLWFFTGNPAFLLLLAIPVVSVMIIGTWKKEKVLDMFAPFIFAFLSALGLTALAGFLYGLVFDFVFLGIVKAFPLFTVVPILLLLMLFFASYGFLALREVGKTHPEVTENVFYAAMAASVLVCYCVVWVLTNYESLVGYGN